MSIRLTAASDERIENLWLDAIGGAIDAPLWVAFSQIAEQAAILADNTCERLTRNELNHAFFGSRSQDGIRREFEVEVLSKEELVHESKDLHDELVLTEVIT